VATVSCSWAAASSASASTLPALTWSPKAARTDVTFHVPLVAAPEDVAPFGMMAASRP
jgi:hypothetical protein